MLYTADFRSLHHHPRQRLGSRKPHQHAAGLAELGFRAANFFIYTLQFRQRTLVVHLHVHQQLRINLQIRGQLVQILARDWRITSSTRSAVNNPSPVVA